MTKEPTREALDRGFERLRGPLRVVVSSGSIVTFANRVQRALDEGMVRLSGIQVTPRGYRMVMGRAS